MKDSIPWTPQAEGSESSELEQRLADANAELLKAREILSTRSAAVEEQQSVVAEKLEAQSNARKAKEDAVKAHDEGTAAHRVANQKREEAAALRAAAEAVISVPDGLKSRAEENDAKRHDLEKRRNDARVAHRDAVTALEAEYLEKKPEAAEIPLHDPAIEEERNNIAASLGTEEERRNRVVEDFAKREAALKETLDTLRPQRVEKADTRSKLEEALAQITTEQKTLEAELEEARSKLREVRSQEDAAEDAEHHELLTARARDAAQGYAQEDVVSAQQASAAKEAQQREAAEEIQLFEAEPAAPLEEAEIDGWRSPHNAAADDVETDTEPDPVTDETLRPAPFVARSEKPLPSVPAEVLEARMQWVPMPEDSPTGPATYSRWGAQVFDFNTAGRAKGSGALEAAAAALADVVLAADFSRQFGYDVARSQKEELRKLEAILDGSESELSVESQGATDERSVTPTEEGKAPIILRKQHVGPAPDPLDPESYRLSESDQQRVDHPLYRELLDNLPSLFTIVFGLDQSNPFNPYQDLLTPQLTPQEAPLTPERIASSGPEQLTEQEHPAAAAEGSEQPVESEPQPADEAPVAEPETAGVASDAAAAPSAEPAQGVDAMEASSPPAEPPKSEPSPAESTPEPAPMQPPPEGRVHLLETPRQGAEQPPAEGEAAPSPAAEETQPAPAEEAQPAPVAEEPAAE